MQPPRYFNAHCHLELSHLHGTIPPGLPFVEWLERLVPLKRQHSPETSTNAAALVIHAMQATGTGALLDIDSLGTSITPLAASGMPAISFTEIIEFDPWEALPAVETALELQRRMGELPATLRLGLSPHAPYTTTRPLLRAAMKAAMEANQWLCIHAAETEEETDFLTKGTGAMRTFLGDRGLLPPAWRPPEKRPIEYLDSLGLLGPRTLLVHVNDITNEEIDRLRETGTRAVVCPGTHVYFERGTFPLERLVRGGVATYLGTDSLASNAALDMAREIELAAELCPTMPREEIEALASIERAHDFGLNV